MNRNRCKVTLFLYHIRTKRYFFLVAFGRAVHSEVYRGEGRARRRAACWNDAICGLWIPRKRTAHTLLYLIYCEKRYNGWFCLRCNEYYIIFVEDKLRLGSIKSGKTSFHRLAVALASHCLCRRQAALGKIGASSLSARLHCLYKTTINLLL